MKFIVFEWGILIRIIGFFMSNRIENFNEFYQYYLREHSKPTCRALHYAGTTLLWIPVYFAITTSAWWYLWLVPIVGYGFAWIGHFGIEKNKPATFQYPVWSLISDHIMFFHFITGKLKGKLKEAGVVS